MSQDSTTQWYDQYAQTWDQEHNTSKFWGEPMERFIALVPAGNLLEIGPGAGRDAQELNELGGEYTLVGIDPSRGMLAQAVSRNIPGAHFIQGTVLDLPFPAEHFDGFWAAASLLHVSKVDMDGALWEIYCKLKSGAVGFIALKKHIDNDPAERQQNGRFFAYWHATEFECYLKRNGFELVDPVAEMPMSERTVWLVFIVRKVDMQER